MLTFNIVAELIPTQPIPTVDTRTAQIITMCMRLTDGHREAIVTQCDNRRASSKVIKGTQIVAELVPSRAIPLVNAATAGIAPIAAIGLI